MDLWKEIKVGRIEGKGRIKHGFLKGNKSWIDRRKCKNKAWIYERKWKGKWIAGKEECKNRLMKVNERMNA